MSDDERAAIANALVHLRVHCFFSDEGADNESIIAAWELLRPLISDDDWAAATDLHNPFKP